MLEILTRDMPVVNDPVTVEGIEYSNHVDLYNCLLKAAGVNVNIICVVNDHPNGPIVFVDDIRPIFENVEFIAEAGQRMGLTEFTRFFEGEL